MSQCFARKARRSGERRAFSLLELVVVLLLIGLISSAAIGRFGSGTLENVSAEGYARRMAASLTQARQSTIATGDNHYVLMTASAGEIASYAMFRRAAGGDVQVAPDVPTPDGLTVASTHTTLEFDFDGAALAAYAIDVAGPNRSWSVTATALTGTVETTDTTP